MKVDLLRTQIITMDNNRTLDDNFGIGLDITTDIRKFLDETARWAYFLSILGFIIVGLIIVIALFSGTFMGIVMNEMQSDFSEVSTFLITMIYLAIAAINLFPVLFLYRFAKNTKEALRSDNQIALADAFKNLKSHYKFIGIMALAVLGFYTMLIIFTVLASMAI